MVINKNIAESYDYRMFINVMLLSSKSMEDKITDLIEYGIPYIFTYGIV